jgi:hypothetical protein
MLRLELVENVVIFTGNREIQLKHQTQNHTEFFQSYHQYLQSKQIPIQPRKLRAMERYIEVLSGQDLKDFIRKEGNTLYIWDESHYGQSKDQQVDKFLATIGIDPTGATTTDDFILSVTATPLSELSNLLCSRQSKEIVKLIPSPEYISVEKMARSHQLCNAEDAEETLHELTSTIQTPGYALVRAMAKKQTSLISIAKSNGWEVQHFDMDSTEEDINAILSVCPEKRVLIFIKGRCRMGKRIVKKYIVFGMETSLNSKTDTLLQGLLGRWCGYVDHPFTAPIYIVKLRGSEVEKYIQCFQDLSTLPGRGMNMKSNKQNVSVMLIPFRVRGEGGDIAKEMLEALDNGTLENFNQEEDRSTIEEIIRRLCGARLAPTPRTPEETATMKYLIVRENSKKRKEEFDEAFASIRSSFDSKEGHVCRYKSGGSYANSDSIVAWRPLGTLDIYFCMTIKKKSIQLPMTTGREITKSKPESEEECETEVSVTIIEECETEVTNEILFSTFAAIGQEQIEVSDFSFNSTGGEEL